MERKPKEPEIYEADEVVAEEEADEKKYLFDAKIQKAHDNFTAILKECDIHDETIESEYSALHTKQRLLFTLLQPVVANIDVTSKNNRIDRNGYSFEQKQFDFTPECRRELHREAIIDLVGEVGSKEEIFTKLRNDSSNFRNIFRREAEKRIRKEESENLEREKEAVSKKYSEKYANVTPHTIRVEKIHELLPQLNDKTTSEAAIALKTIAGNISSDLKHIDWKLQSIDEHSESLDDVSASAERIFRKDAEEICDLHAMEEIAKQLQLDINDDEVAKTLALFKIGNKPDKKLSNAYESYLDEKETYTHYEMPAFKIGEKEVFARQLRDDIIRSKFKLYVEKNQILYGIDKKTSETLFTTNYSAIKAEKERDYIIRSGKMTKEEYDEYKNNKNKHSNSYISKSLRDTYRNVQNTSLPAGKEHEISVSVYAIQHAIYKTEFDNFDSSKFETPNEVRDKCLYKPDNDVTTKVKASANKLHNINTELTDDPQEARDNLIKTIAGNDPQKQEIVAKRVDEHIRAIKRRLYLSEKFYDAIARFGATPCIEDVEASSNEKKEIEKKYEARLSDVLGAKLDNEIDKTIVDFNHEVFGESIEESFILPTGLVFRDNADRILISPMSPNTIKRMADEMPPKYRRYWSQCADNGKFTDTSYDSKIIDYINKRINDEYHDNINYIPESERHIADFCKKYGIKEADALHPVSGAIEEPLAQSAVECAENYLDKYGRYFSDIDVSSTFSGLRDLPEPNTLMKTYLSSGSFPSTVCMKNKDNKFSLIIKKAAGYEALYGQNAVETLIRSSIGAYVYEENKSKLSPIIQKILGDRGNISIVDSIRLTGEKIPHTEERRQVANRAYFISNYNRFLKGDQINNKDLANLIARVDKIVFG